MCDSAALSTCPLCTHPKSCLERLLWTRAPGKRKTLLTVLRWVAYSFRPLEVQELLVAVSAYHGLTQTSANGKPNNTERQLGGPEDLLASCKGLLGRSSDGTIRFIHKPVREFLKSPAMRALDAWEDSQIHEMMAVICLRHVACLDETALLRPWTQAGNQLREPKDSCYLGDYSIFHWHQHFRLAESSSMYLPSLLYQALQAAFRRLDSESEIGEGILTVERRIDQGLQFCCRYDFLKVGELFLEMGAKRSTGSWSAIHMGAAFGSVGLLEFLVRSFPRSDDWEEVSEALRLQDAYAPIELAAFHGRTAAVELLLDVKAYTRHLREPVWTSAFFIAVEYGHQEVVESLLKQGMHPGHTKETVHKALRLAKELECEGIVELISTYEINIRSDLDPKICPARNASSPVTGTDCSSPRDPTTHTLELGIRNLDLSQLRFTDLDVDVWESGLLGEWSLVGYTEAEIIANAHMDVDNG